MRRPDEQWVVTMAMLRRNGNAMATVMDGDGRCKGYAMAMTAMECGGNGGGAPTSNGCHRGMLTHYGRASVHLELSSFGYKYGTPLHRSRDGFTYACHLLPLDVRDLDRAPGHRSKFNGLSYLVRRFLLNPPRGRANNDRWRNCNGDYDDNNIYSNNGGGGQQQRRQRRTAMDAVR